MLIWVLLGLLMGLLQWPYQALSELGFALQRGLWPQTLPGLGALLVFSASALVIWLAWGPLAAGRGGGVAPLLALDRCNQAVSPEAEARWLHKLNLGSQMQRLPLMLLAHVGGLAGLASSGFVAR